jgi:hypothetical protein
MLPGKCQQCHFRGFYHFTDIGGGNGVGRHTAAASGLLGPVMDVQVAARLAVGAR